MPQFGDPVNLSPRQFELAVKGIVDAAAEGLVEYDSKHLERLAASDGEYEIDVAARFKALGANFLVLIECKHHKRKKDRAEGCPSPAFAPSIVGRAKGHDLLDGRLSDGCNSIC
ncbi:hypothetical protein [Stenotrophomonas sp. MYb57]|uniref:hypothetical protein n=1 Tax=Stenotrophomonas sp. MYb57 TaxID=1827305 RepID=UPI001F28631B|nr:hypothetical protein [Stenotrophomonas sp. MYb57]